MSEKFSPGPWCADVDMYDEDGPLAEPEINGAVMDKEGCTVCHCSTEANVHLVAAAPEMYEALKKTCLNALELGYCTPQDCSDSCKNMAALKKARGKA